MISTLPSLPSSDRVAYYVSTEKEDVQVIVKEKIITLASVVFANIKESTKTIEKIVIVKKEGKDGS